MATREIEEWEKIDAANNFPAEEGGWVEGMKRSDVNDAGRADMGAMRRWYDDPEWLNLTVNASLTRIDDTELRILAGDFTAFFKKGRRVRMTGGAPSEVFATVDVDATPIGGDTKVILTEFSGATSIPVGPTLIESYITAAIRSEIFLDELWVRVTDLTDIGLQAAIDKLEAANGGTIVLEANGIYDISNTVNIGRGAIQGNIKILGQGAKLKAISPLDEPLLLIRDDPATAINANVIIHDLEFDGEAAGQTAAGAGKGMLEIGADVSFVWLRNCFFNDSYAHGIKIVSGCKKIWIADTAFFFIGENGIEIVDSLNDVEEIYIGTCTFERVANTAGIALGSGIHFGGKIKIRDCDFIKLNAATDTQIGVHAAEKITSSPNDQSGRETSITGCRFDGTGLNARGIFLQGRDVSISSCVFRLTGVGSEGIFAELVANTIERFAVTGCQFLSCQKGVQWEQQVDDSVVQGCLFDNRAFAYEDDGNRNRIIGSTLNAGTDGVTLGSTATLPVVTFNHFEGQASDGVAVAAGSDAAMILYNRFNAVTTDINDLGTATGNLTVESSRVIYKPMTTDGSVVTVIATEVFIPNSQMIDFSGESFADGVRTWVAEGAVSWNLTLINISISFWKLNLQWFIKRGTDTGSPSNDPEIFESRFMRTADEASLPNEAYTWSFAGLEFVPLSTDTLYLAVRMRTINNPYAASFNATVLSNAASSARFTWLRVRPI